MEWHYQLYKNKQVRYGVVGEGEPLMLIHGYQTDCRIWKKIVPLLKGNYQLILPDLPGHGASPLIRPVNSMEFLADVVYNITLSLGLNYVTLVGHSMGGYIAVAFADKYSSMVERLILISSHPFQDSLRRVLARDREGDLIMSGMKNILLKNFVANNFSSGSRRQLKSEITEATSIALEQPEDGMLADLTGMMARNDKLSEVNKGRFHTSYVLGKDDSRITELDTTRLENRKASINWLEDCGHMAILEKPEEVVEIINSGKYSTISTV